MDVSVVKNGIISQMVGSGVRELATAFPKDTRQAVKQLSRLKKAPTPLDLLKDTRVALFKKLYPRATVPKALQDLDNGIVTSPAGDKWVPSFQAV